VFPVTGSLESHLVEEVQRWIYESKQAGVPTDDYEAYAMSLKFMELLQKIWKAHHVQTSRPEARTAIQKTIAKMEEAFAYPLTRDELAKLASMSPTHYSSVFKRELGKSPTEVLAEIRIRHAKKQLMFGDHKIRDVAENVGFRNEFYFSRQFKQLVGVSPSTFVRQHYAKYAKVSRPFSLHLKFLGLNDYTPSAYHESLNVVGLYVEDFLVSLGVTPVLKCVGNNFRQRYLNANLNDVQEWSVLSFDFKEIADTKPDLIILGHPEYGNNGKFDRFSEIAPTYSLQKRLFHWDEGIRIIGQLLNRSKQAETIIADYKQRVHAAQMQLTAVAEQTVTLIRICNDQHIRLYGGPEGYSGVVLYKDLGLKPSNTVLNTAWNKENGYVRIELKELYELETDHLFVVVDPAGRDYWKQIVKDYRWNHLTCVRQQRCYEVCFDSWMTFGIIAHQLKVQDVLRCLAPMGVVHTNNCV
jgi:ABC-type Fe3+-hydroxamate transport system substrate-binding protein/AraC-like DNA-binding protein